MAGVCRLAEEPAQLPSGSRVLVLHPLQMVTPGRKRQGAHQATGQPGLDSGPGFPTPHSPAPGGSVSPFPKWAFYTMFFSSVT